MKKLYFLNEFNLHSIGVVSISLQLYNSSMAGKQAKTISREQEEDLLTFCEYTRHPERNLVMVLLSVKAGLRAGEIAALTWDMVLASDGGVGTVVELRDRAAKKGSGRQIPLHPVLRDALVGWRAMTGTSPWDGAGPVVRSERGGPLTPVSVVNWSATAYRAVGVAGCSSHSGRRTSSPGPLGWCTRPAVRCVTFSCWPATDQLSPPSGTSTVIRTCSANWCP